MLPVAHTESDIMLDQDEATISSVATCSAIGLKLAVLTSSSNSLNMVVICTTCAQANIDWSCKSRLSRAATRLDHEGKRKLGKRIGWNKALQVLRNDCMVFVESKRSSSSDTVRCTHGTKK
jgi:hypothetical protein